jgi:hypothetical protein
LIDRIDHFVLTVQSLDRSCAFYVRRVDVEGKPTALTSDRQKINVHQADHTSSRRRLARRPDLVISV